MNTNDLILELGSWGQWIRPEQIGKFDIYLNTMLRRNRVLFVESEEGLQALIFYFLIDDKRFVNKPTWAAPEDTENGAIFFVDKMFCRKWTKSVRFAIQDQVEAKYPVVREALWLRSPKNRHVILKRRGITHGIQS